MQIKESMQENYIWLLKQVIPYWKLSLTALIATILLAAIEGSIPALLKPLLDGTFIDKDQNYIFWAPIGVIILFSMRGLFTLISRYAFVYVATQVIDNLRVKIFEHLLHLPLENLTRFNSAELSSKITHDTMQITSASTQVLTVLVKDSITIFLLALYIFWLDWQLSLFTLLIIPVITPLIIYLSRRMRGIAKTLQINQGKMSKNAIQALSSIQTVKTFNAYEIEQNNFSKLTNNSKNLERKYLISSVISLPVVEISAAIIIALAIYVGFSRPLDNEFTVGSFVSFFGALGLILSPAKRLLKINESLQRGLAAVISVREILSLSTENNHSKQNHQIQGGEIIFSDVFFTYQQDTQPRLKNLNFCIPNNKHTVITGPSGGGKSTIVNLIPKLLIDYRGKITINGCDINEVSTSYLRSRIAFVNQHIHIFEDTIYNNIAYGSNGSLNKIDIVGAAKLAHIHDFIVSLPNGYDTILSEDGGNLSGGQRQRISLARALAKKCLILIMDEGTSSLDKDSQEAIRQSLNTIKKEVTIISVAHRAEVLKNADHIIYVDNGVVEESGDIESLRNNPNSKLQKLLIN